MKQICLALSVFLLLGLGYNAKADDNTILSVFNNNKQSSLYITDELDKTLVIPTPSLPTLIPVTMTKDMDSINQIGTKDIKIMTSNDFRIWLSTNNQKPENFNIKDAQTLYNQNWYFTVVSNKVTETETNNSIINQAKTIDPSITLDNFPDKLSQIILDIYQNRDYTTYIKWRSILQELLNSSNATNLTPTSKIYRLIANKTLPSTEALFNNLISSLTNGFKMPAVASAQNISDAKLEIKAYLILSAYNESREDTSARFLASGVDNYNPSESLDALDERYLSGLYYAMKKNDFDAFRRIFSPIVAMGRNIYADFFGFGDNNLMNAFNYYKTAIDKFTVDEFINNGNVKDQFSIKIISNEIISDISSSSNKTNYFLFRLDFATDRPIYNFSADADFTLAANKYYQSEAKNYPEQSIYLSSSELQQFDELAPDWKVSTSNYIWSVFSLTNVNNPLFFTALDAEGEAKITSAKFDSKRVSDIKQIMTALELYFNDERRYPEYIKTGGAIKTSKGTYMSVIPANPSPGGIEYSYTVCGNGEAYQLKYKLESVTGSIKAGINIATPASISDNNLECKQKNYQPENKKTIDNDKITCQDSDNGRNYEANGKAVTKKGSETLSQGYDTCQADSGDQKNYYGNVIEFYCDGSAMKSERVKCANGCMAGKCQPGPIKTDLVACRDSDGGKNYNNFGWVYKGVAISDHRKQDFSIDIRSDHCSDGQEKQWSNGDYLVEYYCIEGSRKVEIHQCDNGCQAGRCLSKGENRSTEKYIDTDGGKNYFVGGATFYNTGDQNDGFIGSEDFCTINQQGKSYLDESYIGNDGWIKHEEYTCPNGCADGACLPNPKASNQKSTKTKTSEKPKSFSEKNAGKIFLQVEAGGEAWYISPQDYKRYYLKDGLVAYQALRQFGIGITNTDLAKIPVGLDERVKGEDSDNDGLEDKLESALGTNPNESDSDSDSFTDGQEILNGYNPKGSGQDKLDQDFSKKLEGKIVLQVEGKGEAWYVYQGKRYYLANGDSAYKMMRFLSTGISDNDLEKFNAGELSSSIKTTDDKSSANAVRRSDINTILNAIYQWSIDNNGAMLDAITSDSKNICRSTVTQVRCHQLAGTDLATLSYQETYLTALPIDPLETNPEFTGYFINKTSTNKIIVTAPYAENGELVSVIR